MIHSGRPGTLVLVTIENPKKLIYLPLDKQIFVTFNLVKEYIHFWSHFILTKITMHQEG